MSFPPGTEMFQFPGFAFTIPMYSASEWILNEAGFPHSEIPGQSLLTAPRGLSQRATSFIAS